MQQEEEGKEEYCYSLIINRLWGFDPSDDCGSCIVDSWKEKTQRWDYYNYTQIFNWKIAKDIQSWPIKVFKNCWTASTVDQREITEQDDSLHQLKKQIYSYSDVVRITNEFSTIVGKGGFGTVYLGYIGDTPVAVKMLSPSSVHGYRQFQAEVSYL